MSKKNSNPIVVLLHGLGRKKGSMAVLDQCLHGAGFQTINLEYNGRRYPVEVCAEHIWNALKSHLGTPVPPLNFVTHSLGGIVVRQMADMYAINICRCVMIAPPNQGSELVDFGRDFPLVKKLMGKSGLQLGIGENSLPNRLGTVRYPLGIIAGNRPDNPFSNWIISNPNDGRVAVNHTKIAGMTDFTCFPYGHFYLIWMPKVKQAVVEFLRSGNFPR